MIREHEAGPARSRGRRGGPWSHARPDRWAPVPAELDRAMIAGDRRLAEAARRARGHLLRTAMAPPRQGLGAARRAGAMLARARRCSRSRASAS